MQWTPREDLVDAPVPLRHRRINVTVSVRAIITFGAGAAVGAVSVLVGGLI